MRPKSGNRALCEAIRYPRPTGKRQELMAPRILGLIACTAALQAPLSRPPRAAPARAVKSALLSDYVLDLEKRCGRRRRRLRRHRAARHIREIIRTKASTAGEGGRAAPRRGPALRGDRAPQRRRRPRPPRTSRRLRRRTPSRPRSSGSSTLMTRRRAARSRSTRSLAAGSASACAPYPGDPGSNR